MVIYHSFPPSLSLPISIPLLSWRKIFWSYSRYGLIHRVRLHGPEELSLGKSTFWGVLGFLSCVESWLSWYPLAFIECLVNRWEHQKIRGEACLLETYNLGLLYPRRQIYKPVLAVHLEKSMIEKILANDLSDKGLVSKIYKELLQHPQNK